jgi:small-conductance mechanosensitive channel
MSTPKPRRLLPEALLALCFLAAAAAADPPPPAATATAAVTPAGAGATAPAPSLAAPMPAASIIQMLDETIDWYRTLGVQQQAATEPSDMLFLYDNRQTAGQVMALAFDLARVNAEELAKQPSPNSASAAPQPLNQLQNKFAAQGQAVQAELESDRHQLAGGQPDHNPELQAKISELQGELDLINARRTLLGSLSAFSNQDGGGGYSPGALKAQIDAMAVTMPAAANTNPPPTPASATSAASAAAARFGIWNVAANVVRLSEKMSTIELIDRRTAALQATFSKIREPLVDQLKAASSRGDALAAQADTDDSATLNRVHDELDSLSDEFKQASARVIPLSKEDVLLNQYRRNLHNWRDSIKNEFRDALKALGVRLLMLAVVLALVFAAAEIWVRAVVHYVQDPRRRHQFLLLRKIALWSLIVVIVGLAFASELGSIVTFAGLITAGLAVAMQSVLVSIVGYFFLIGKYGIRVGDRVQIGDVTGEVIELGLVRMYLMELGGRGLFGPTGRVVAFANSIVFQVSSGLFKQIHGVNFVWREIVLNLPAGIDYAAAKAKLMSAMAVALKDYREEIVRQTQEIQRATASSSGGDAQPRVQLSFAAAGVEAHIRYPVYPQNAAEIDERVTQQVVHVISGLNADSKTAKVT